MKDTIQTAFMNAARDGRTDVIHHMLSVTFAPMLKAVFNSTNRTSQSFDDSIDDFLLFLYHGPDYMRKAGLAPYSIILRISSNASVTGWLASAYRIRLLQANNASRVPVGADGLFTDADSRLPDMRRELCDAIAACVQYCTPIGRFLVLRWLLTALEPTRAIAQAPMAAAAGLTPVNYRVSSSRARKRLAGFLKKRISSGIRPDGRCLDMSDYLFDRFDTLYDCLLLYYDMAIDTLPRSAHIMELRERLGKESGLSLHELRSCFEMFD